MYKVGYNLQLFRRAGRSRYGYLRDLFTDVSVKETVQPAHEWAWRPAGWGSRRGGDVLSLMLLLL